MKSKKKKPAERTIFDSIRKPVAPPSRRFGKAKPEEKANPAQRKTKYKKRDETDE